MERLVAVGITTVLGIVSLLVFGWGAIEVISRFRFGYIGLWELWLVPILVSAIGVIGLYYTYQFAVTISQNIGRGGDI